MNLCESNMQITNFKDFPQIQTKHIHVQEYLQHTISYLETIKTPWVLWTANVGVWHIQDESALLTILQPNTVCLVLRNTAQMNSDRGRSWYTGTGIPLLWRTETLLTTLKNIPTPPSWRYLPFIAALLLPPEQVQEETLSRQIVKQLEPIWPPLTQNELESILSIVTRPSSRHVQREDTRMSNSRIPMISIVICAYNEERTIQWAMQSVFAQTYPHWELIIVDDGSTDLTSERVREKSNAKVILLHSPVNRGKSFALNDALTIARGVYLLELDADDWLSPLALANLYQGMHSFIDPPGLLTAHFHLWQQTQRGELLYKGICYTDEYTMNEMVATPPIPRFYQTNLLRKLGGWPVDDLSQGRLFEDVAICSKILKHSVLQKMDTAVYHRVLRKFSISQIHHSTYTKWAQHWFKQF